MGTILTTEEHHGSSKFNTDHPAQKLLYCISTVPFSNLVNDYWCENFLVYSKSVNFPAHICLGVDSITLILSAIHPSLLELFILLFI